MGEICVELALLRVPWVCIMSTWKSYDCNQQSSLLSRLQRRRHELMCRIVSIWYVSRFFSIYCFHIHKMLSLAKRLLWPLSNCWNISSVTGTQAVLKQEQVKSQFPNEAPPGYPSLQTEGTWYKDWHAHSVRVYVREPDFLEMLIFVCSVTTHYRDALCP